MVALPGDRRNRYAGFDFAWHKHELLRVSNSSDALLIRGLNQQGEIIDPQQGDLRLSCPPSGQGAGGRARTRDRWIPAVIRTDSPAIVPPTSLLQIVKNKVKKHQQL
ncbi:hypothetical protein PoB_004340300 [Plakobranchus ocellatus]|uniref:Uncharacterized protein n=1 Tax=Plakobranchus ocellatus TaxID=259542 RepID=A0AAV4BBF7_9GAST|nr:hypothetical protein PoB_004340300 [Plakobranchus ocellatus]